MRFTVNKLQVRKGGVLKTDHLDLRHFSVSDAEFILSLLNDPSFIRFIGDKNVRTTDDARQYIQSGPVASYEKQGFGLYLVQLRGTKTPIGMCGLLKRDALEHPDIGFAFLPDYRRQGYASESVKAVLSLAKKIFTMPRILAITNPDNHSSIKLLEKMGFNFERIIKLPDTNEQVKLFEIQL